mmetsp:Transcript_77191/g.221084  ORF Transcript_77191/g.221084 Transcript_77191/m.221084 type:complete len:233 (+) Transcript_77191:1008-1706(+)
MQDPLEESAMPGHPLRIQLAKGLPSVVGLDRRGQCPEGGALGGLRGLLSRESGKERHQGGLPDLTSAAEGTGPEGSPSNQRAGLARGGSARGLRPELLCTWRCAAAKLCQHLRDMCTGECQRRSCRRGLPEPGRREQEAAAVQQGQPACEGADGQRGHGGIRERHQVVPTTVLRLEQPASRPSQQPQRRGGQIGARGRRRRRRCGVVENEDVGISLLADPGVEARAGAGRQA